MGPATRGFRRSDGPTRILVLVEEGRNRELIRDFLDANADYDVFVTSSPADVPDAFDFCLVHYALFDRVKSVLADRKRASDPVYLPTLLLLPPDSERIDLARVDESLVHDVVTMPVRPAVLKRRISNLLGARHRSVRLAERTDQFRQLVELTPEGILLLDTADVVYANVAMRDILRVESESALRGRSLFEFVAPRCRSDLESLLDRVSDRGRTDDYTDVVFTPDGDTEKPTRVAGVRVVYEGTPVTQLLVHDLSERKAQEERLNLLGRAVEVASQGITIADARRDDEPLVYANAAFQRITGYSLDEILGRNCRFLQGEHTDPDAIARVDRAIASREPVSVELLNYRKDGAPFWNQLDVVPVENERGEVTHFLGLQRDVTERKKREQRVSVLDRVLRHNLRNQMNVIIGYAGMLDEADDSEVLTEKICIAARSLLELSRQVRTFRGVVTDEARDRETLDLAALLDSTVAEVRRAHPDAAIDLSTPPTAPIWGHPTLPLAVRSLLQLTVTVADPMVDLRVERGGETVTLVVTEWGDAITARDLRVLDADGETQLDHLQGIELWLVRWAVEGSGGELHAESDGAAARLEMRFHASESASTEASGSWRRDGWS